MSQHTSANDPDAQLLAAIDLGSNSFHMVVARLIQGELKTLDILSDKVQLAAGLDARNQLSEEAQQRGLECLGRFAQYLKGIPNDCIKVVGTNALRRAKNADEFRAQAEQILGTSLEIIAGREEARLIYLGVAHTLADDLGSRLVIDIGGGSTEFIIGERFEPKALTSLEMGCVSYTKRFFADGKLSPDSFRQAVYAGMRELLSIQSQYREMGWQSCVGSSGTIKAIRNACIQMGLTDEAVTRQALFGLRDYILKHTHIDGLDIDGIKPERMAVLPAGVAVLCAAFEALGIDKIHFSEGALREGLLYDMTGRLRHEDVRERTITALMSRYHVDAAQAEQVERTALLALAQLKDSWDLKDPFYHDLLSWAARTHEIGLSIAHSQYHKHSAYLLQHSDLAGFTQLAQLLLATIVRGHRRKIPKEELKALPARYQEPIRKLMVLLRLAIILHRSRQPTRLPGFDLAEKGKKLILNFPPGWLQHHPLTAADLEQENDYLNKACDLKWLVE